MLIIIPLLLLCGIVCPSLCLIYYLYVVIPSFLSQNTLWAFLIIVVCSMLYFPLLSSVNIGANCFSWWSFLFSVPFPPPTQMPFISPTFLSFAKHFINYACGIYIILTFPLYIVTSVGLCCVTDCCLFSEPLSCMKLYFSNTKWTFFT